MAGRLRRAAASVAAPILAGLSRILPRGDLAAPITRSRLIGQIPRMPALEIGPFNAPKLRWPGVAYADVLDRQGLRDRALSLGLDPAPCPAIDFVTPAGDLGGIKGVFEAVFSAHCIEHQPDLVRHLRQVESILAPGGAYYLVVPDKRYCFDHYLPETTLADVCAAWAEKRMVHTPRAVLAHRLRTTHNDKLRHWLGLHGPDPYLGSVEELRREGALAEAERARAGAYIDVHAWYFTPAGFRGAVHGLLDLGLMSLHPEAVHATALGAFEFFAILRKAARH
jgi:SAM-dependent methyltransferase